jgi:hypothetical protein
MGDGPGALLLLADLEGTPNVERAAYYQPNLAEAVRTALAAGDAHLAARLAEASGPAYPMLEHAIVTARALLAEHRGSHAEAAELFASAAERWERFEMPWERAHALFGQGRCLLALGRASGSSLVLRDARDLFASFGAKPALADIDMTLARAVSLSS